MPIKKTYERILFMVIGAVIASFGYLIGEMDSSISAKEYQHPRLGTVVECDQLFVRDTILVGDPNKSNITLKANSEISAIVLSHQTISTDSNYIISVDKTGVLSKYLYGNPKNPDSIIQFTAENNGTTSIYMASSIGNGSRMDLGTSHSTASLSIKDIFGDKKINTIR